MAEMENKKRNSRGIIGLLGAAFKGREPQRDPDPLLAALERLDRRLEDLPQALSGRMEASLGSLADSLRADRGERTAWEQAMKETEARFQAVADAHLARTRETLAGLARTWDEATQGHLAKMEATMARVADSLAAGWKEVQSESKSHFKSSAEALEEGIKAGFAPIAPALSERIAASLGSLADSLRADREERTLSLQGMAQTLSSLQAFQKVWAQDSSSLLEKLGEQGNSLHRELSGRDAGWRTGIEKLAEESGARLQAAVQNALAKMEAVLSAVSETSRSAMGAVSAGASEGIRDSAAQAETWLKNLSEGANRMQAVAQEARRMAEDSSANQAGLKAVVEMLNQSLTGVLDRLQSFASLAQGQEALLEKMEATLRRFEERSVELLEDNALKIQESFLDALEKIEGDARGV
jgi:hypothetical protein